MPQNTLDFLVAPRVERGYVILCLVLVPLVVFFSFARPWDQLADFWETAAAVQAASHNLTHPGNPLLDLPGDTSPRFTPFVLAWGAVMQLGIGLFTVMGVAGIVNYVLFVTGLFRFVGRISRSGVLPTYMLLVMLVVWGTGYGQANSYHLRMFLETLSYVGMFAYGLCFHALAYLRRFLDLHHVFDAVAYGLLMALAFVTHPITAAFGFTAALAMLVAERDWRQLLLLQVVPLVSLVCALRWPYFDYWTVLTKGTEEAWFKAPMFEHQVEALGPALIGIPIAGYYALKRRHLFIVYGVVFCGLIYFVSDISRILIGSRFLLYTAIFLHLAIAVYLFEHGVHKRKSMDSWLSSHGYLLIIVFMVFAPGLWFRAHEFGQHILRIYKPPLQFHVYASPTKQFFFLRDYLDDADVVLANDTTAWVLPAITGARIVSQEKGDPLITAQINIRRKSVEAFLYHPITTRERVAIIRRFRVTYVLLDRSPGREFDDSLLIDLSKLAQPVATRGSLSLYKIVI